MSKASFQAKLKDFKKNDKHMEFKLIVQSSDITPFELMNALNMVDSKINVHFGDPQLQMNFDENSQGQRQGVSFTTDSSGVVGDVKSEADYEDDHYEDMYGDEGTHDEDETPDQEPSEDDTHEDTGESEESGNPDVDDDLDEDSEHDQEHSEERSDDDDDDEHAGQDEHSVEQPSTEIDKETLEAFILSGQAPTFKEIEFDFPAILARKHAGETWMNIASSEGVSSGSLQAQWRKYKELVAPFVAASITAESGAA